MNYSFVITCHSLYIYLTLKLLILLFWNNMKICGKKLKMLIAARIIHIRIIFTHANNKTILSCTKMCFRCVFILNDYP